MLQKRRHVLAWLGFIAVTMLMYPGVWLGQNDFSFNDIINLNLPQRQVAADIWSGGEIPLWNRYAFGGQPLLAAMQAGVLYPLNLLFLWLQPQTALNVSNLLHQVLAGGFMYLFLFAVWRRSLAAFTGGVIFMSSGFMAAHVIHTQMMNAVVWIPLILYFLEQLRQKGTGRYAIGLTVTTAIQILSGHPQVVYYTAIIVVLYMLYVTLRERQGRLRFLLNASAAFLLSAVVTCMQLIPTAGLIRRSFREAVSYDFFAYLPLTPAWLGALLVPFRNGAGSTYVTPNQENWWEVAGYVGVIALVLAVGAAIRYWKRDWHVPFFAGLALIGLFIALGDETGATRMLYHVPVANWFRVPARFVLFFDIAVAALAARAIVALQERSEQRDMQQTGSTLRGTAVYLGVIGVLLSAVLIDYWRHTAPLPDWVWFMPAAWLLVLAVLLLAQHKWPAVVLPLLVAGLVYDNVTFVRNFSVQLLPSVSESRIATEPGDPGVPEWIAMMQRDPERFRIASFYEMVGLNRAGRYHLEALNGYDSLYPEIYEQRVDLAFSWSPVTRSRQLIDVLNAKYVITNPDTGISLTTPGVPSVTVPVTSDRPVSALRFRYEYSGPKNMAPLARVVVTGADGTRDAYPWRSIVELPNAKSIKQVQIEYTEWHGSLHISSLELLDQQNDVITGTESLPVLAPPWKERYKDNNVIVYENTAHYPRYWMTDSPEDPSVRTDDAQIRETGYKQRENSLSVSSKGGWLVISQLYDPGWKAYVDGERTIPDHIGLDLTGIPVSSGTHDVLLRYEPAEWTIGLIIGGVGVVVLLGWIVYLRRKGTF